MPSKRFPAYLSAFLDDITCFSVSTRNWEAKLYSKLGIFPGRPLLQSVLHLAVDRLNAKTIIAETYISTDWADEYQASYSRSFRDFSRRTTRLHFFRGIGKNKRTLSKKDLYNLPVECTRQKNSAYLGYSVIRPFERAPVGDTVLRSPYWHGSTDPVHCASTFKTHLLGHELFVRGMPFVEQDGNVSVCAEADLWMVARYMHRKGESRRYRPSEMASFATRYFAGGTIRDGLNVYQMYSALKEMGLNPEFIVPKSAEDAIRLLYTSVESEIPVIVTLEDHVFTVIGRSYSKNENLIVDKDSVAKHIDAFIAHDDQRGLYLELEIKSIEIENGETRLVVRDRENPIRDGEEESWEQVLACFVPMPSPRIGLREADVRGMVRKYLIEGQLFELVQSLPTGIPKSYWPKSELTSLVNRIYLRRSDQFKRDILPATSKKIKSRDTRVIALYLSLLMPKYVWVVELSEPGGYSVNDPFKRRIVGEMLFDASSHHRDIYNALLSIHLNGRIQFRGSFGYPDIDSPLPQDNRPWFYMDGLFRSPYSPLIRSYK